MPKIVLNPSKETRDKLLKCPHRGPEWLFILLASISVPPASIISLKLNFYWIAASSLWMKLLFKMTQIKYERNEIDPDA